MSLRIIRLAAGAFLQDRGRPGWRRYGVPPGGAFDRESYELALALVGRTEGAVLEIPLMGGSFDVADDGHVAVVGASGGIRLDHETLPPHSGFDVRKGQRLTIEPPAVGARTYLALRSGWRTTLCLGSASNQSPLEGVAGDAGPAGSSGTRRLDEAPDSLRPRLLRVLPAPQSRPSDRAALAECSFQVGLASNRLGIRLEGGAFEPHAELPSEASVAGAVQATPSGEAIVHGPDGPTIGGYPKVAIVIDADLDRLAQLRAGEPVSFEWVEFEVAALASSERSRRIARQTAAIRAAQG